MKQCYRCKQLLADEVKNCIYCGDKAIAIDVMRQKRDSRFEIIDDVPFKIVMPGNEEQVEKAYKIIEPIGKGGFGRVIEVEDAQTGRHYAMKVPFAFDILFSNHKGHTQEDLDKSGKYLLKEIDTFAGIRDKNFNRSIQFTGNGYIRGRYKQKKIEFPVFLMELAEASVKDIIQLEADEKIYVSFKEKKKIMKSIVNAINALHHLGIVHRDLSPDNILIVNRDGELHYVLGDFGGSKEVNKSGKGTSSSQLIGKNSYIDPERIMNISYRKDYRMDIYSLGIIITEILMGNFWGKIMEEQGIELLAAVDFEKEFLKTDGAGRLEDYFKRENLPEIAGQMIDVLGKAVKRKPTDRYDVVDSHDEGESKSTTDEMQKFRPCLFDLFYEEKEIDFYFTIELPLPDKDETFLMKTITIDKETKRIELDNFKGAKFQLSGIVPKEVKLKNTSLLSSSLMEDSFILKFKGNAFNKLLTENIPDPSALSGKFKFKASICIVEG